MRMFLCSVSFIIYIYYIYTCVWLCVCVCLWLFVFERDRAVSRARRPRLPSIKTIVKNASTDTNCAKPTRRCVCSRAHDGSGTTGLVVCDSVQYFPSLQFFFTISGSGKETATIQENFYRLPAAFIPDPLSYPRIEYAHFDELQWLSWLFLCTFRDVDTFT